MMMIYLYKYDNDYDDYEDYDDESEDCDDDYKNCINNLIIFHDNHN